MTQQSKVVILDDFFPELSTGFRVAEFNWLMKHEAVTSVLTTQPLAVSGPVYAYAYPEFAERVRAYHSDELRDADLAWMTFLNNAAFFLDDLERSGTPFVVTLYPGGGLNLGDPEAEEKLLRVLGSPQLRAVITTQPRVTEHVQAIAPEVDVREILGVVVNPIYLGPGAGFRSNYFDGTNTLRLCFAAHKYTPRGEDKGYDVFVDVVRGLREAGISVEAHVIGGFDASDIDVSDIEGLLTFHGMLETTKLKRLFSEMDLVVSPNRPGVLSAHAFDGFPLGSVIEAALCGAAMIATDELAQNRRFLDGRSILIVGPSATEIVGRIVELIDAPGGIGRLAQAGLSAARRSYGVDAQLWSRLEILNQALAAPAAVTESAAVFAERA